MKRCRLFIDYDKEEKWLNEMAKQGYELEAISLGYKFRRTKPENTIIRVDYRTFRKQEDFIDYCTLFEDSGWKHIAGSKYSGAQYFKKIDENSTDDIFSDAVSKAGKYKRLSDIWAASAVYYLPILIVFILTGCINVNAMLNPKLLYYTPGLWEMTGINFWRHFLFETPFALSRGFMWLLLPLMMIFCFFFAVKAKVSYYKQKKSSSSIMS